MENTLALTGNWLDTTSGTYTDWTWNPNAVTTIYTYPYWHCCCDSSIRLTLKEVDVLRRAARKDVKLRKVLEKLTPKIEVDVSFDG